MAVAAAPEAEEIKGWAEAAAEVETGAGWAKAAG